MTVEPTLWEQPPDPPRFPRPEARARATDDSSAHDAAEAHSLAKLTHDQTLFLLTHADHPDGLTDFEVAALVGKEQTAIGPRRPALMRAGLIERTDDKRLARPGVSTAMARVWRITPAGIEVASRLRAARAAA